MRLVLAESRTLGLYLAVWALAGLGVGALVRAVFATPWTPALAFGPAMGLVGGPMWLSARYVARAAPLATAGLGRLSASVLLAALTTAALWASIGTGWWDLLGRLGLEPGDPGRERLFALLAGVGMLGYLLAVTVAYVGEAFEASAAAARQVLEAEVAQRDAELRALRARLDPHFLFNSLNSVAGLIPADPDRAREMCQRLADFFRDSLRLGATARIPLGREVALAEQYLRIEQVRFGDRLRIRTTMAASTSDVAVPPLLLQPLVENAVRHGIATSLDPGEVAIEVRRAGERVVVTVTNPRDEDVRRTGTGLGLDLVRRRLAASFGDAAALTVTRDPGEFRASLVVPAAEETP